MSDSQLTPVQPNRTAPRARRRATGVISQYIRELAEAQPALGSSVGLSSPCAP